MEVSELTALDQLSEASSDVFESLAKTLNEEDRKLNFLKVSKANNFVNLLALYRATGEIDYLERAKDADKYLEERMGELQSEVEKILLKKTLVSRRLLPWVDLYEMYDETGDKKYLEAAHKGACDMTRWLWAYPVIPDGNTIHKDGRVYESH